VLLYFRCLDRNTAFLLCHCEGTRRANDVINSGRKPDGSPMASRADIYNGASPLATFYRKVHDVGGERPL
jgi:hypothetical protein